MRFWEQKLSVNPINFDNGYRFLFTVVKFTVREANLNDVIFLHYVANTISNGFQ
jgi:hypothetical protein